MIEFLHQFWLVCGQLAPWLFFGSALSALLHVSIPTGFFQRHLRPGPGGVIKAAILGVPMPLCSCGVIPAAIALNKEGASKSSSMAFLISTPQTGLDSIFVSASLLSWPFAIFKLFSAFITGIIGGLLFLPTEKRESFKAPEPLSNTAKPIFSFKEMWNFGFDELFHSIWKWLLIGIVISAAINTFVPESFFLENLPENDFAAALFMLAISLPLYVCATASVPVAAALIGKGLPLGAAIVFLMAGPASNAATIGAVYRAFGRKFVIFYLITVALGSLVFAQIFGFVLPEVSAINGHIHQHTGLFEQICGGLLLLLFTYCLYLEFRPRAKGSTIKLKVEGLSCQGCVNTLRTKLRENAIADDVNAVIETKVCTLVNPTFSEEKTIIKLAQLNYQATTTSPKKSCCQPS